jgi:hypothetical protein
MIASTTFTINITGPAEPYNQTLISSFNNPKLLVINVTDLLATGRKKENLTITFAESFLSIEGTKIYNTSVWEHPYRTSSSSVGVRVMGGLTCGAIGFNIAFLVVMNMLLGKGAEVLWSLVFSLQIMYYHVFMDVYFSDQFVGYLSYLGCSNLDFGIPIFD